MDDGEHNSKRGVSHIVILTLIMILNVSQTGGFDVEIENMRQEGLEKFDISIFAEERVEYIHSRITLKPLISSIEYGSKMSEEFGVRANSSFGRILSSRIVKMVEKVEKRLLRMYGRKLSKRERRKRAIEIVGNLISKLFGNPGPEDWKQNTRNIVAMKEAIERQLANSVILHHDIDQNRHAINTQNENLKLVSREVINNKNRLTNVDNALSELESYLELESMYESIEDILESLEDIRRDAKMGRCNEKGLDPDFLIEHLRQIESNKAGIAPIFASWEWQKYYSNEMCTIAVHGEEIWITMRIPIINLAEQLVRAIPLSNQRWIKIKTSDLGIETELFKLKQLDTYTLVTKANLETCSKLGTSRVCNIRKTKFRESNPYIVPLDIGHGRIVLVTNVSATDIEVKSVCEKETESIQLKSHSVIRIPEKCALVSKSFEISKAVANSELTERLNIGTVDRITVHRMADTKGSKTKAFEIGSLGNLTDSREFESNNNATIDMLKSIKNSTPGNSESLLIASSSSLASLLIGLILVLIIIRCSRHCGSKRENMNGQVVVVVDETKSNVRKIEQDIESANRNEVNAESAINAKDNNDLETENKKPAFQRKH
jgi:hypothetical protein